MKWLNNFVDGQVHTFKSIWPFCMYVLSIAYFELRIQLRQSALVVNLAKFYGRSTQYYCYYIYCRLASECSIRLFSLHHDYIDSVCMYMYYWLYSRYITVPDKLLYM